MNTTRGSTYAPLLAAILLAGLLVWHSHERDTSGNVDLYMSTVRQQVRAIKYNIGPFLGSDAVIAPAAIKLLKPNIILQRQYVEQDPKTDKSTQWFSLLIVQCGIANDMYGHYPPACYPRAGWVIGNDFDGQSFRDIVVHSGELSIPAREYHFSHEAGVIKKKTDILSFFIVPTGSARFGGDMKLVDMASRAPATAKLGAAQVQILTPADLSDSERKAIWDEVLISLEPVLKTIAEGV